MVRALNCLASKADIENPDMVSMLIAQSKWKDSYKANLCDFYNHYCKHYSIRYVRARYRRDQKIPKVSARLRRSNAVIQDIFLGSMTDSYQPIESSYGLTRQIVEILKENELPFTTLTKSDFVMRDIDLFKHNKWCRIGVTVTSLDENFRKDLEPYSASYNRRIRALRALKAKGTSTYLSGEPIFPVKEADPMGISKELKDVVDLFEFGRWNARTKKSIPPYYCQNHSDACYVKLFREIIEFCESRKIKYRLASHSREFIETHGLPLNHILLSKLDAS
jgi:hypothetical protein